MPDESPTTYHSQTIVNESPREPVDTNNEKAVRMWCLEQAIDSFEKLGDFPPSNSHIKDRADTFERFVQRGL